MRPRGFLLRSRRAHLNSTRAARCSARIRLQFLPTVYMVAGVGVAGLVLTTPPERARQLRRTMHLGVLIYHQTEVTISLGDAVALFKQWSDISRRGALEDKLIERLLSCILRLGDDQQFRDALRYFVDQGALVLLIQYTARKRPTDPTVLQPLVLCLTKLLKVAFDDKRVDLKLPVITLAQALGHLLHPGDNVVSCVDVLQFSDALMKVQQSARQKSEADASQCFIVERSYLVDRDTSNVAESCAALVNLCSPEMPDLIKKVGLRALETLAQAVNHEELSGIQSQQLKAALEPTFATMLMALPRDRDSLGIQLQAAMVMDSLVDIARRNPAAVTRDTYELWMEQICYWTNTEQTEEKPVATERMWNQRKRGYVPHSENKTAIMQREAQSLQLQLISSRCMRTLTASPQSRRYVCESINTRAALFSLSLRIHETKETVGISNDQDSMKILEGIQRHASWTFRNICTGYQSGATALSCLFGATWTATFLQSRQNLPMSRIFRGIHDFTDLPVIGAEEYEASIEYGWVDILTAWSASTDRQVRENATRSLVFLAEQHQPNHLESTCEKMEEIRNKQEQILQAWLTNMLQRIRLLSGGELLAVKQMEEIAHVSKEMTPGNEQIIFDPAVVDAGTSALAILAEHHHAELVQQGVVPLIALLAATSAATPAQHTQCARVLANLVATYCLKIDPHSSALSVGPARDGANSDHIDIARLLRQTASGKQFLRCMYGWREYNDPMQRSNYFRVVHNLRAYDEVVTTGRLVMDVYCEGVHPIVSRFEGDLTEECVDDNGATPLIDVVFVHGLRGHPFGTWRTDMGCKNGSNDIWPATLLAKDLERMHVPARLITLGYEAGMVSWSSPWPSLTLQERARDMLSALYAANVGRDRRHPDAPARPVVFVTHSMGGLLTKIMLLLDREQCDQSGVADSTEGVIFLAVPHFGSELAKGVRSESIRKLIQTHPAIEDLGADPNGRLKKLNDSFKTLGIGCFSVGEELASPLALGLSAVVVKPHSADPGIGRFYVLSGSDHMTICKVKSRSEVLYQDILQYIVERASEAGVPRP